MLSDPRLLIGAIFGLIGGTFLIVGLWIVSLSYDASRETAYIETLPVLNAYHFRQAASNTEAVVEGTIAERNALHINGFVAYTQYEYQGERCTTDDHGYEACRDIWEQKNQLTPALLIDLNEGRLSLSNDDYELVDAPTTWQSIETLIEYQTQEYIGFKLGDAVLLKGQVVDNSSDLTFTAEFIYGGDRATFLANQHDEANSLFVMGLVFSSISGLFLIIGLGLLLSVLL